VIVDGLRLLLMRLGQRGLFYPKPGRSEIPWPREAWGLARADWERQHA
jgi:hypothetical protein